jgi:aspartyl-tRNA(Asn)/glutamyl-tRNA(Gln) amidotransferase subunit C
MQQNQQSRGKGLDVAYVAHLARLHLTDAEVATFQPQMEQIVGYVKQIDALDVSGVEPTSHAVEVVNVFREDRARPGLDREQVMANAPSEANGLFAVPKIVE